MQATVFVDPQHQVAVHYHLRDGQLFALLRVLPLFHVV
jgi:hypothetical protein